MRHSKGLGAGAPSLLARVLALVLIFLVASCGGVKEWRRFDRPWTNERLAEVSEVRILRVDEPSITLRHARIRPSAEGEALIGIRPTDSYFEIAVPLDHVSALEVRRASAEGLGVVLFIVLVIAIGGLTIGAGTQLGTLF